MGAARPGAATTPIPPGIESCGITSKDGPAPSTCGPNGTIGGGIGIPGSTRGFGRPGFGVGTNIADTMDNSSAGIANTPERSQYAMQLMFGGEQTPYHVEQGKLPPYMEGRNMRGSTLAPEHSFSETSSSDHDANTLAELRKQSDERMKSVAGSHGGGSNGGGGVAGAVIAQQSDKGDGGGMGFSNAGGVRAQAAARLAAPGMPPSTGSSVTAVMSGGVPGTADGASMYRNFPTMDTYVTSQVTAPLTAFPGFSSGMTNVAY